MRLASTPRLPIVICEQSAGVTPAIETTKTPNYLKNWRTSKISDCSCTPTFWLHAFGFSQQLIEESSKMCSFARLYFVRTAKTEKFGAAVDTIRAAGNKELTLMHCISAYLTELEETRLGNIRILRETFGVDVGFSDHTLGSEASLPSIHFGATMIEKHFILSREDGGVDSKFSLNTEELMELTKKLSSVASAVSPLGEFERSPREQESLKFRRSLYFAVDRNLSDVIQEGDIRRVRPGFGLPPKQLAEEVGKKLKKSVKAGQPVTTDLII